MWTILYEFANTLEPVLLFKTLIGPQTCAASSTILHPATGKNLHVQRSVLKLTYSFAHSFCPPSTASWLLNDVPFNPPVGAPLLKGDIPTKHPLQKVYMGLILLRVPSQGYQQPAFFLWIWADFSWQNFIHNVEGGTWRRNRIQNCQNVFAQIWIKVWLVVSKIFGIFTPNFGEDEPNLTFIFFKGVGSTTN